MGIFYQLTIKAKFSLKTLFLGIVLFSFVTGYSQIEKSSILTNDPSGVQIQFKDTSGMPVTDLSFEFIQNDSVLSNLITDKSGVINIPCKYNSIGGNFYLFNQTYGIRKNIALKKNSFCLTQIINIDSLKTETFKSAFQFQIIYNNTERPLSFRKVKVILYDSLNNALNTVETSTDMSGYFYFKTFVPKNMANMTFEIQTKYGTRGYRIPVKSLEFRPDIPIRIRRYFAIGGCPSF